MKRTIFRIGIITLLAFSCGQKQIEKFSYSPNMPHSDQKISVTYNPSGTDLSSAEEITMFAYQYTNESMPHVNDAAMMKKGILWEGSFTPVESTFAIVIQFQSGDFIDDNDRLGYTILLHDSDKQIIEGSQATLASVYMSGGYPMNLKRDPEQASKILQKEFQLYPNSKDKYRDLYFNVILRTDQQNGKEKVISCLDSIAAKDELTLDDQLILANWYSRMKLDNKADKYKNAIRKAEPMGEFVQTERLRELYDRGLDLKQRLKLFKSFKNDFPKNKNINSLATIIVNALIKEKRYDEAEEFITKEVPSPESVLYNEIAWELVQNNINLKTAVKLGKKAVDLAMEKIESPLDAKPSYLTEKQWEEQTRITLGNTLDTYGYALYKSGDLEEAIETLQEAVELTNKDNAEINERYAQALLDNGETSEAFQFLETLLKNGKSSPTLKELFKKAYIAQNGSEDGLDIVFKEIETVGLEIIKEDLSKKMEKKEKIAPNFTLSDLDGNSVALSDLKGKVVILDFWATWCGPCKSSFPGMQKAVEKFKEDNGVQFLFVNTWERGDNVKDSVAKFIDDNNYSFHVLMDLKNEVVSTYEVEGIPTKFIIDPAGKIRFISVGFSGDTDAMVQEISLMIDMIR